MFDQIVAKGHASHIVGESNSNSDGGEADQPLMPTGQVTPSAITVGKRKVSVTSCQGVELADEGEVPLPTKRMRGINDTGYELEVSLQFTLFVPLSWVNS